MSYIYQVDSLDLNLNIDNNIDHYKSIILNTIATNYIKPSHILKLIDHVEKSNDRHIYDSHPFAIFCLNTEKINNIIIQKSVSISFEYELDFDTDVHISDSDIADFIELILKNQTYNIQTNTKTYDICSYCSKELKTDIVDLYCGDSYHLDCLSTNMNYDCFCPKCPKLSFFDFIDKWYDVEYDRWVSYAEKYYDSDINKSKCVLM